MSDIADKVGVILGELGEQEEAYSHGLEDSRGRIKAIRNTEKSVQPSREGKSKIVDEIQKVKFKEPESTRLVVLEQELVRAEAENLVAEAQLNNVVSIHSLPSCSLLTGMLTLPDTREAQAGLRRRVPRDHRAL